MKSSSLIWGGSTTISQPAVLGGLFIGVLSALPIVNLGNLCCCLWVVCGGVLGAYLDQQNDPRPITVGRGALAGLLSGVLGAVVWLLVSIVLTILLSPLQQRLAGNFARDARDLPPEVRTMLEFFSANPSIGLILQFVVMLFAGVVFATLGPLNTSKVLQ